jgi:hypothetical protein
LTLTRPRRTRILFPGRQPTPSDPIPGRAAGYPDGSPTDPDERNQRIRFLGVMVSLRRWSAQPVRAEGNNSGGSVESHPGHGASS